MNESDEVREERERRRLAAKEARKVLVHKLTDARDEVNAAIDSLEHQPRSFGGHRSADQTSTIDACPRDRVQHRDGRIMRFVRLLDPEDTPYATALVTYRGRWLVVPAVRLQAVG